MSDTHTHTSRRRNAAPRSTRTWVRRAGLVGGVVSALALCGAAAPAMAETSHDTTAAGTAAVATANPRPSLLSAASTQRAVGVLEQEALSAALSAEKEQAATEARQKAAALHHKARAKAAAAKAARERAKAAKAASAAASASSTSSSSAASSAATASNASATTTAAPASGSKVDQLIAFLKAQIGKPYVYGATGPSSYDCSGLTQAAFASVGVTLPRTSQEQSTVGTPVSLSALQPGDLIFWGGEGSAFHVGVFIGGGQYLDAANPSTPVGIKNLVDYEPDWAVRVL
ncbi:C40 family peptidase [Actinacidiphila yeochonensis]|uniref:C40 family peptidase n=1 Tax=Actinacidiphila yeochonensis TaxID=89050 RepID=UPI000561E1B1|nr:C40 family peptidase [Actinacidiphila yeochonensis]